MALNINGTTGISGVDASVSAPALTGTDSNTGISFPSADTIKFSTNGVERFSISNSGLSGDGSGLTGISGGKLLTSGVADSWSGSTASTSYVDSYSFNITPSATSSKVLILAAMNHVQDSTTNWSTKVLRDSTSVFERSQWKFSSTNRNFGIMTYIILDAPSTTSQITYKFQIKRTTSGGATTDGFNYTANLVYFEVGG
tara:strand:- start:230 stop:826 length:597 start_codon:yes stop_codon:yes gene_type:complete